VVGKFPKIEAQAYDYREVRMDAGVIPGDYGVESSDNREFSGIFLSKISKGKKFNFHAFFNLL
jgi:hypothetical protein